MEFLIIIGLIILNGVLAMSEIAMVSARKSRLETEAKSGNKSAQRALKLANQPDRFLSTIQIGITLIGILTGLYSGQALAGDLAVWVEKIEVLQPHALLISKTLIVIVVTYLTLIFGELQTHRNGRRGKNGKTNCRPDGYSFPYSLTFRVVTLCQHVIHDETIGIEQIGREQNHGRGN